MTFTICIENLHPNIDVPALCESFKCFGRIIDASIETDKFLRSLSKAYISFDNVHSSKEAVKKMNKYFVFGRYLKVYGMEDEMFYYTKVFVKNFDINWDEIDLESSFQDHGKIVQVYISRNGSKSNSYGFVKFHKHESAKSAVESLNGKIIKGCKLSVQPFQSREKRNTAETLEVAEELLKKSTDNNNLHVKNIPKDMQDSELEQLFQHYGKIVSVKISRDDRGKSKGFGFVCYSTPDEAKKAKQRMDKYSVNSHILEVNFFQKKVYRQQYLKMRSSSATRKNIPDYQNTPNNNTLFHFSSKK